MISKYIVLKREKLGLSREEFAKKVGITYNTLTLIEKGHRKISKKILPKMAKVLKISVNELKKYNFLEDNQIVLKNNDELNDWLKTKKIDLQKQVLNIDYNIMKIETEKKMLVNEKKSLLNRIKLLEDNSLKFIEKGSENNE